MTEFFVGLTFLVVLFKGCFMYFFLQNYTFLISEGHIFFVEFLQTFSTMVICSISAPLYITKVSTIKTCALRISMSSIESVTC